MRRITLIASTIVAALLCATSAEAQTSQSVVVSAGGTPPLTYTAGQPYPDTQDTTGKKCTSSSAGGGTQPAPLAVTPTDRGGTITLGGTSQTLAAANANRKMIFV